MDISRVEPLLRQYGVEEDLIEELRSAAAGLPPELTDGSLAGLAKIDGLTDTESQVLASRILWKIAPILGVTFTHPNVLDLAGYPQLEELMAKADGYQVAQKRTEYFSR